MNRIVVGKEIVANNDSRVVVDGNVITFNASGDYLIEYEDIFGMEITLIVKDVSVNLLEVGMDKNIEITSNYKIENGSLKVNKFYNNRRVDEKIRIDLCHSGDRVDYNFSSISVGEENYQIDINHNDKNTVSNISNKSVALDGSNLKFILNSRVKNGCKGSILDQNTRIVTMGECKTKICPNMFIDLDDAIAKHGSVIGTFKEEQIFYLMSKGIEYQDALKLLVKGYLLSNILVTPDIRMRILERISKYWR